MVQKKGIRLLPGLVCIPYRVAFYIFILNSRSTQRASRQIQTAVQRVWRKHSGHQPTKSKLTPTPTEHNTIASTASLIYDTVLPHTLLCMCMHYLNAPSHTIHTLCYYNAQPPLSMITEALCNAQNTQFNSTGKARSMYPSITRNSGQTKSCSSPWLNAHPHAFVHKHCTCRSHSQGKHILNTGGSIELSREVLPNGACAQHTSKKFLHVWCGQRGLGSAWYKGLQRGS